MDTIDGVTGVAQGERDGKPVVEVYASRPEVARELPTELDGFPVVVTVTGPFTAGA